jgi:hypothetical protein
VEEMDTILWESKKELAGWELSQNQVQKRMALA